MPNNATVRATWRSALGLVEAESHTRQGTKQRRGHLPKRLRISRDTSSVMISESLAVGSRRLRRVEFRTGFRAPTPYKEPQWTLEGFEVQCMRDLTREASNERIAESAAAKRARTPALTRQSHLWSPSTALPLRGKVQD